MGTATNVMSQTNDDRHIDHDDTGPKNPTYLFCQNAKAIRLAIRKINTAQEMIVELALLLVFRS
jgi:hypothetical protein